MAVTKKFGFYFEFLCPTKAGRGRVDESNDAHLQADRQSSGSIDDERCDLLRLDH